MKTATERSDRGKLLIFVNILISAVASSMLSTATTAALPPIAADLSDVYKRQDNPVQNSI